MKVKPVKIDSNIPLPSTWATQKYDLPFDRMAVGQSFICPAEVTRETLNQLRYRKEKQLGRKFVTRATSDGIRVWRVE